MQTNGSYTFNFTILDVAGLLNLEVRHRGGKSIDVDCPLCGKHVVRGRFRYGCMGYSEGCSLSIPMNLCHRDVPLGAARDLLTVGETRPISGFISKNGKPFTASLALRDGKVSFLFDDSRKG